MTKKKHRIRGTIKSFFEKYADPEKLENLKETGKDLKEKTKIVLDIVGNQEGGNPIDDSKRGFVAGLIEDFQKQYETLYSEYDHLTEELKSKAHHEHKETFSSSDSDSEKSSKNGRLENGTHEELTNKVAALSSEKEQLTSALDDARETETDLLKQIDELKKAQDTIQEMHDSHKSTLEHELNNLRVQDREMKLELERKTEDIAENLIHIQGLNEKLSNSDAQLNRICKEMNNLEGKVKNRELELEYLNTELEKMEGEKEEFSRSFSLLDDENTELKGKLEEQLRILKAVEDELNEKKDQFAKLETRFLELENVVEERGRKLEEFQGMQAPLETVEDLERTIEDLKRDLEASEDEAYTATEKTRTIEVQLRLSNQKLRLTEQLLIEKEESFNIAEKKYLEECEHLEEKITKLTHIITLHNETYQRMITNISESMYNSLSGMESVAKKYEDEHEKFSSDILNMSQEIQIVKHLEMAKKTERENFEKEKTNMLKLLQEEKHEGSVMREKINGLKNEVDIAVKKKDEMKAEMEEEKREAIRQLCLWCDYLLNRNYELKEIVSKFTITRQQQSR